MQRNANGRNGASHYLDGLNGLQKRPRRLGHKAVHDYLFWPEVYLPNLEISNCAAMYALWCKLLCTYRTLLALLDQQSQLRC